MNDKDLNKICNINGHGLINVPWIRGSKTKPGRPKLKKPSAGRATETSEGLWDLWQYL